MSILLEDYLPPVQSEGLNTNKPVNFGGAVTRTKVTATASGGAATANGGAGVITTETLSTAAGSTYVLHLTNSSITPTSVVVASVNNSTNSAGTPAITTTSAGNGDSYITVQNVHASAAFNGSLKISFLVS